MFKKKSFELLSSSEITWKSTLTKAFYFCIKFVTTFHAAIVPSQKTHAARVIVVKTPPSPNHASNLNMTFPPPSLFQFTIRIGIRNRDGVDSIPTKVSKKKPMEAFDRWTICRRFWSPADLLPPDRSVIAEQKEVCSDSNTCWFTIISMDGEFEPDSPATFFFFFFKYEWFEGLVWKNVCLFNLFRSFGFSRQLSVWLVVCYCLMLSKMFTRGNIHQNWNIINFRTVLHHPFSNIVG